MKKWLAQTEKWQQSLWGHLELGSGSLSPASAGLQPGHELLGCLVLQVGAHIAGVGAVCVPSKQTPLGTHRWELCSHPFALFDNCCIYVLIKTKFAIASETPVVPSTFKRFRSVDIYRPTNHSLALHRSGSGALQIKSPAVAVKV